MYSLALLVSVLLWSLSGCTTAPAPHDSSTRVLNEMKVARPAEPAKVVTPPADHRLSLLEQRVRELEGVEARNRELEALLEAERAKVASLSGPAAPADRGVTKTYDDLVTLLQPEITKGNIHVAREGDRVVITLADRLLFESGSDRLKTDGVHVLEQVGHVLHERPDMRVQVDGHTDNVPIGERLQAKFPNNLALSQARANHVADALRAAGVSPMNLEAAGHGERRPVGNNMLEEGRRKNRRVELIAYPREN